MQKSFSSGRRFGNSNGSKSQSFGRNKRPGSSFGTSSSSSSGTSSAFYLKPRPKPAFGSSLGNRFGSNNRNRFGSRSRGRGSEPLDVNRFIRGASDKNTVLPIEITHSFQDFDLCPEIQTNLKKRNFSTPTPIQDQSIEHITLGKDLIGLANTGTGKTGAFLLPLINKVFKNKSEKVLIVAPTRELAMQIEDEFRSFSWGMKLFSAICVGGMPVFKQIQNLKRNPNFIIGTPGRLKDLSERKIIRFDQFTNVVIDEVDRMLDMGFVDEIRAILNQLPKERQSLFFSATIPPRIKDIFVQFLNNPVTVEIKQRETAENVDQDVVRVRDKSQKFNQLQEILRQPEISKVLIFSETKIDVDKLTSNLSSEGFKADCIHGDKRQRERQRALNNFKNNHINILVATDVAARGLDIKDVSHVINYTVPQTYEDYIHRIGRTGRGNASGKALTFVDAR